MTITRIKVLFFLLILTSCNCKDGNVNFPDQPKKEESRSLSTKARISNLFNIESSGDFLLSKKQEEVLLASLPTDSKEFEYFFCQPFKLKDGRTLYLSYCLSYLDRLYAVEQRRVLQLLYMWTINMDFQKGCETYVTGSHGIHYDPYRTLKELVQKQFGIHVQAASEVLEPKSKKDIISFWKYYFDGPHPENYKNDFDELHKRYSAHSKRVGDIMKTAYEELIEESDGHGH